MVTIGSKEPEKTKPIVIQMGGSEEPQPEEKTEDGWYIPFTAIGSK